MARRFLAVAETVKGNEATQTFAVYTVVAEGTTHAEARAAARGHAAFGYNVYEPEEIPRCFGAARARQLIEAWDKCDHDC